jgi:RsiW-degrading membrane proteinase PrsW (M82 family)
MDTQNSILLYIVLGILGIIPSFVWLLYYLRKDLHPEPKKQILRIFFWGAIITIPVLLVQLGFSGLLELLIPKEVTNLNSTYEWTKIIIQWFLVIAFVEELFKFLVVRIKVLGTYVLDEPLDLMLYSVVSALGLAAVENIFYLIKQLGIGNIAFDDRIIKMILLTFIVRFLGATLLHTLCSSIIGYSLAMSLCETKRRRIYVFGGLVVATIFHGFYNLSFKDMSDYIQLAIPASILLILSVIVFIYFEKLKKMKGVCNITK